MAGAGTPNPAITLRTARVEDEALIEVEDNGPGIPAELLNRVFEPFYTTKKVGEGTGLGLSVSYFIITTTHRGKMSVDSWPGRGTRFSIRLPLERTASPAAR
jgi:signal transduction histidine kinase